MVKFILLVMVALGLGLCAMLVPAKPHESATTRAVLLQGEVDIDMLNSVRAELEAAEHSPDRRVRFDLLSPGGGVVVALEIARLSHVAQEQHGVTVEMHASSLCASACTLILASGSRGYRVINKQTLFLVHPVQGGNGGCLKRPTDPTTQDEKALEVVYDMLVDSYSRSTGEPAEVIDGWMICGHEFVGRGDLAVDMRIADYVER